MHELQSQSLQSHCGDNREGTLFSLLHINYGNLASVRYDHSVCCGPLMTTCIYILLYYKWQLVLLPNEFFLKETSSPPSFTLVYIYIYYMLYILYIYIYIYIYICMYISTLWRQRILLRVVRNFLEYRVSTVIHKIFKTNSSFHVK